MTGFAEALRKVAARVPEAAALMIIATDGIPVEKLVLRPEPNLEALAAECSGLLRSGIAASRAAGLGQLRELAVSTDRMIALLVAITSEYYLLAALSPRAIAGRARFALRLAGEGLQREFQ